MSVPHCADYVQFCTLVNQTIACRELVELLGHRRLHLARDRHETKRALPGFCLLTLQSKVHAIEKKYPGSFARLERRQETSIQFIPDIAEAHVDIRGHTANACVTVQTGSQEIGRYLELPLSACFVLSCARATGEATNPNST